MFDHNQPEDTAAVLVGVVHNLWVSLPKTQVQRHVGVSDRSPRRRETFLMETAAVGNLQPRLKWSSLVEYPGTPIYSQALN